MTMLYKGVTGCLVGTANAGLETDTGEALIGLGGKSAPGSTLEEGQGEVCSLGTKEGWKRRHCLGLFGKAGSNRHQSTYIGPRKVL